MIRNDFWETFFKILFWIAVTIVFMTENKIAETIAGVYALAMIVFYIARMKKQKLLTTKKPTKESSL